MSQPKVSTPLMTGLGVEQYVMVLPSWLKLAVAGKFTSPPRVMRPQPVPSAVDDDSRSVHMMSVLLYMDSATRSPSSKCERENAGAIWKVRASCVLAVADMYAGAPVVPSAF